MGSNSIWCDKCGNIKLEIFKAHKCPPHWETNVEVFEEDEWERVYAVTPEAAAEKRAREIDLLGDYSIVGGSPITVRIKTPNGIENYEVSGEAVPEYTATHIKPTAEE